MAPPVIRSQRGMPVRTGVIGPVGALPAHDTDVGQPLAQVAQLARQVDGRGVALGRILREAAVLDHPADLRRETRGCGR